MNLQRHVVDYAALQKNERLETSLVQPLWDYCRITLLWKGQEGVCPLQVTSQPRVLTRTVSAHFSRAITVPISEILKLFSNIENSRE